MRLPAQSALVFALLLAACAPTGTGLPLPGTGGVEQTPPEGDAEVTEWLAAGHHEEWECQAGITAGSDMSAHGRKRICFNDAVVGSSLDGPYPVGAAVVKELYDDADERTGTAILLKVADGQNGGSWYWYEKSGEQVVMDERNAASCAGCHTSAGNNGGHEYVFSRP